MNKSLNHLEWASGTIILWLEAIYSLGRRLMTSSCLLVTAFLRFTRLPLSNNTLGNLYRYLLLQVFPVHLGSCLGRQGGCVTLLSLFSLSHPPAHPFENCYCCWIDLCCVWSILMPCTDSICNKFFYPGHNWPGDWLSSTFSSTSKWPRWDQRARHGR